MAVIACCYVLGGAAILLWPNTVSAPFKNLLASLRQVVPYGDRLLEIGANVLLFVPAGWLLAQLLPRGFRWVAILGGAATSAAVEVAQAAFLPGRVPSLRDFAANTVGAALGVLLTLLVDFRRPGEDTAEPSPPSPRQRRLRAFGWGAAGLVVVLGALGAWVAVDALRARDALMEVVDAVPGLTATLREDPADAATQVAPIQDASKRARAATTGVHWAVTGWLPWIGENTRALQVLTAGVDSLAAETLPSIASAGEVLTPENLAPTDGRINTGPLAAIRADVVRGDEAVGAALDSLATIDDSQLVTPVLQAVHRLEGELREIQALTSAAASAVQLLPGFLGADGPREWLVLAQNNAELRASGGIPGAAVLLSADDGRLGILEQRSSGGFGPYGEPVLPLTTAEERLFGPELGLFLQDVTLTPDFPRSAALAAEMWRRETGSQPSSVLSIDPVALAGMLTATGPVEFIDPFGEPVVLTSEDTAEFLMSGVYSRYQRPEHYDAVFALASGAILERLTAPGTDPIALLRAVTEAVGRHRILVWSADAAEQALVAKIGASGQLTGSVPTPTGPAPALGVYLNLTTASKTGYYLDARTEVTTTASAADGSRTLLLTATLTSLLQPGEADALPEHVKWGNRDGMIRLNVLAYAPTSGTIAAVDSPWRGFVVEHDDLEVSAQTVKVPAGESVSLRWEVVVGPDQPDDAVVTVTPGARDH